jgi:hypothetical protein
MSEAMREPTWKSEVARFRYEQELRDQAAQLGLSGPAEVASHERILARMERGAELILELIARGKHDEAIALMNTENWGVNEQEHVDG